MDFIVIGEGNDHSAKVVEVMATVQGADGPTEITRSFTFRGSARYKVDANGKTWPKTGKDYKAEIGERLDEEFSPKV